MTADELNGHPSSSPQHKKRIAQWYEAESNVNKPELDEQFFEQLQETIVEAIESAAEVSVTYHARKRFSTVNRVILKRAKLKHQRSYCNHLN